MYSPARILSFDVGLYRAGWAISDFSRTIAIPMGFFSIKEIESSSNDQFTKFCRHNYISDVVLGISYSISKTKWELNTVHIFKCFEAITNSKYKIHLINEDYTSKIFNLDATKKDAYAAACILQVFINQRLTQTFRSS